VIRIAGAVLPLVLFLGACSTAPVSQVDPERAYQTRSSLVVELSEWEFTGRLSMDDGVDGGSGRLNWHAVPAGDRLEFRGAMGRGSWRLSVTPGEAMLEKGDGTRTRAASVDELIQAEIGWQVPVDALRWWVQGLAAPGVQQGRELDGSGLLRRLEQRGWTVGFERYQLVGKLAMPSRLEAVKAPYRIKLAVSRWALTTGDDKDE
jgi:outer membrane lipoprotein LolB